MKKKFKLLTSIASLGLAIALMAFGVYAAASKSLDVTSSVSFEAGNVNAKFEWAKVEPTTAWALPESYAEVTGEELTITYTAKLSETNKVAGYAIKITNNYAENQTINIAFTAPADLEGNGWEITANCATSVEAGQSVTAVVYVTVDATKIVDGTEINLDSAFELTLAK